VLPTRAPERVARDLFVAHRSWVESHQRRILDRRATLAERPSLDHGRSIPIDGMPHAVIVTTALHRSRSVVRVEDGARLVVERAPHERHATAELLETWLRELARDRIGERLGRRAVEMDLEVDRLRIADQRTRWGSASRSGTLSFNWRLVMAPPHVLDYVVVHELAHVKVSGHGRKFWQLVERYYPDPKAARRWLRLHHDELRHALD